jgi:flagellar protein FlgJ
MRLVPIQPTEKLTARPTGTNPANSNIASGTAAERAKAEKVAADFESLFIDMMLQSMRKTAIADDQSNAQSIYTSMLDSEYAKQMSSSNSFGIKGMLLDWMEKNTHAPVRDPGTGNTAAAAAANDHAGLEKTRTERSDNSIDLVDLKNRLARENYALQLKAFPK